MQPYLALKKIRVRVFVCGVLFVDMPVVRKFDQGST
jgi:hypothetical protein